MRYRPFLRSASITSGFDSLRHFILLAVAVGIALSTGTARADTSGITTQGNTGGLVIPSAEVLNSGAVVFTAGNFKEPKLGTFSKSQNYSFGVGLFPNLELFGRFAEYQNPLSGSAFNTGVRDISANVKWQLPSFWPALPKVALGLNDISGGAVLFKSRYVVASDRYGPLRLSVGYAQGIRRTFVTPGTYAFNGLFGGAELALGETGLSALAEHDGQQNHAGLRYHSPPIPALGNAQVIGTAQRSFGATDYAGRPANATSFALSLMMPLGEGDNRPAVFKPEVTLASLDAQPNASGMVATPQDRLDGLLKALVAAGLERVRVGTRGQDLLVEYENHRYGQNESDAIGIALGLGAEWAPKGTQRIYAVTFKAGQRLYATSVNVTIFRAFLRDADEAYARTSLAVDRPPDYTASEVAWINEKPSFSSPVRIEFTPDINYTVGTEVGPFDYSLAADVQGIVPLWQGAELYTSYLQRISTSVNMQPGGAFASSRQRNGLKVVSLQQGFWLGDSAYTNIGLGRFNYSAWGAQVESAVFVPGRDDVVRLRAAKYQRQPDQTERQTLVASASYRWVYSQATWVEAGVQQYSDGSRGPSVVLTRWFGDVAANLFYRKGGSRQFAGLEFSIPLTPRQGMQPGLLEITGTSQFTKGLRTQLASSNAGVNAIDASGVRDIQLDYSAESRQLNSGRLSQRFFIGQLQRMRESFFLYARQTVPQ